MPAFTYKIEGQLVTVALDAAADGTYRAVIDGRTYSFRAVHVNGVNTLILDDGETIRINLSASETTRYLQVDGTTFTAEVSTPNTERRSTRRAAGGDLSAQMPGQVREVAVAAGDHVTRGQTLIVLEAMKMEMRLSAPTDGVIKRVLVKTGDVVERGQVLIEVE